MEAIGLLERGDVVPGVLAKHQQFVEVFFSGFCPDFSGFTSDFHRGNHSIMDVGRHAGNAVRVRSVVASTSVPAQAGFLERLPSSDGCKLAAFEPPDGVDGGVDVARLQQRPALVGVGELMLDHHGLKRKVPIVGLHLQIKRWPSPLQALFSPFFGGVPELERAIN